MDLGLAGKVALVSGSYRGTGSAIAEVLANEGASVAVHGFETGQADEVVARLRDANLDAQSVTGDLMTDAGAEHVVHQTLDLFGQVDILVNNYGVAEAGRWMHTTTDEIADRLLRTKSLTIEPQHAVAILGQCDLVKFAKASLADEASRPLIEEALALVDQTRPAALPQDGGPS